MYCKYDLEKYGIQDTESLEIIFTKFNNSLDFSSYSFSDYNSMIYVFNK